MCLLANIFVSLVKLVELSWTRFLKGQRRIEKFPKKIDELLFKPRIGSVAPILLCMYLPSQALELNWNRKMEW